MSTRRFARLLALVLGALLAVVSVYAQSSTTYSFTTSSAFTVANKKLPSGHYQVQSDGAGGFLVSGASARARVPVITRLAQSGAAITEPKFVFDKLQTGEQLLSEIWLPGEDGYLVCTMEKEHKHVLLSGVKKGT